MLGILLMLLKIIGWILLGILGLFAGLVLLVLFIPIPYRAWVKGDSDDLSSLTFRVKIFSLQMIPKKEKTGKKRRSAKEKHSKTETQATDDTAAAEVNLPCETASESPDSCTEKEPPTQPTEDTQSQKQSAPDQRTKQSKHVKKEKKQKKQSSVKDVRGMLEQLKAEFTDEGNRRAVRHVIKEIRYLLRHFGPRHVRADVSFSLGDPANTGYAAAALSVCPFSYGKHTHIIPDFEAEQLYLRGWLDVRGHVRIVHLLISGCRLLFDRDMRNIIRRVLKKKKKAGTNHYRNNNR